MSNPVKWRGKGRTTTPNSRQKRNKLYLDAHPVCTECRAAPSEHAHHMLDATFPCRTSWLAMRPMCEPCHVRWHKPISVAISVNGVVLVRARVTGHERVQYRVRISPAG
jgi:hypothetical protein